MQLQLQMQYNTTQHKQNTLHTARQDKTKYKRRDNARQYQTRQIQIQDNAIHYTVYKTNAIQYDTIQDKTIPYKYNTHEM